jgi:hypothetical protein
MAGPFPTRNPSMSTGTPLPAQLVVQYVGFQDAPGRREYLLMAQSGDKVSTYTVSIAREAFDKRRAMLQDGPDICYQKLVRALADAERIDAGRLAVTEADLVKYRDAHTPAARRPRARRPFQDTQAPAAEPLDDPA